MTSSRVGAHGDPYRRRLHTPLALDRTVTWIAAIWGMAYLGWRITDSLFGVNLVLGVPLVIAEVIVWVGFGSFAHRSWRRPRPISGEPVDLGTVDVFVSSLNDPAEAIRATLIGCHALAGAHTVWVLDDGHRAEIASLAAEHGAEYVARATDLGARGENLNHAMALSDADFVMFLAAGEVPMPDIFGPVARAFADDRVGAVAAGFVEHNPDLSAPRSLEHAESEIMAPSLDRVDAAAWEGGPLVVRRSAHESVGGLPSDTVAPDLGYTIRLWRAGWVVRLVPMTLAKVPGPANLTARLALRDRRVLGRVEAIRHAGALTAPGLTLHQRSAGFNVVVQAAVAAARVLMLIVAIVALATGTMPLQISGAQALTLLLPALGFRALAVWLLSDGRVLPFDMAQYDVSFLGVHLRALRLLITGERATYEFAPRGGVDPEPLVMLSKVPLLAPISVALWIVVLFRAARLSIDGSFDGSLPWAVGVVALAAVLCTIETFRWARHRERRHYGRLPVEVSGRLDGTIVRVLDVVGDGMGIETGQPLEPDRLATVSLHLPDPTGALHDLHLTGRVRWVADVGDGLYRAGIEFIDLRPIEHDRLVEFSAVTVPYHRAARALRPAS